MLLLIKVSPEPCILQLNCLAAPPCIRNVFYGWNRLVYSGGKKLIQVDQTWPKKKKRLGVWRVKELLQRGNVRYLSLTSKAAGTCLLSETSRDSMRLEQLVVCLRQRCRNLMWVTSADGTELWTGFAVFPGNWWWWCSSSHWSEALLCVFTWQIFR